MKILSIFILFFCISIIKISSQNIKKTQQDIFKILQKKEKNSIINLHQDSSLYCLVKKHIKVNEEIEGIPGYRIQIFFGSGRNAKKQALKIKSDFLLKHPELKIYLLFKSPYFKLHAGDYRTKYEAMKDLKLLKEEYPGCFIVKDIIKFPELK